MHSMICRSERLLVYRDLAIRPSQSSNLLGECMDILRQTYDTSNMITFIGPETAGKTTVSTILAKRLGGHALRVPTWPSLDKFIISPEAYAFTNQVEAMSYTVAAAQEAARMRPQPLFADSSPDRIHLVHSWGLKNEGFLSSDEWEKLEEQYDEARRQWGPHYIYLRIGLPTILQRLEQRGRPEDLEYNLQSAATFLDRWEDIVADTQWRKDRRVLEVNGEACLQEVCETTEYWAKKQLHGKERRR